ncbi:MAG: hypothetical protein ACREQX_12680 [Candidatus Binataceae bacterium]
MAGEITLDEYRYAEIYPSFKAGTDEKVLTATINRRFIRQLGNEGIVLVGSAPIRVADIGCGPCDTLVKYLSELDFPPGFIVRATDFNPAYADPVHGAAVETLNAAKVARTIPLMDFAVQAGDAFAGHLRRLLTTHDERTPPRFRLVYSSHLLYHAATIADCEQLLADISGNILAPDGVCLLYHLAKTPHTFQDFRDRYGRKPDDAGRSDTPAVAISDPAAVIDVCCAKLGVPLAQLDFSARLRFTSLRNAWDVFKDIEKFAAIRRDDPAAYEDLKRLFFVVQRAPREFAADQSATGLDAFIDEIRPLIESHGGYLPLSEKMQVVWRPDAPAGFSEEIIAALDATLLRSGDSHD